MKAIKNIGLIVGLMAVAVATFARPPLNRPQKPVQGVSFRNDCDLGTDYEELKVNNVRAGLMSRGDAWYDYTNPRYVVPRVGPGELEVSSMFAGSVWLGGRDNVGNYIVACVDYGNQGTDFYPGPLTPGTDSASSGVTDKATCKKWDKHFVVYATDINQHIANYVQYGDEYPEDLIPRNIKGWPARGNRFFYDIWNFELPNTSQGLASFYDQDGDGNYEPDLGDYPTIEIRGCPLNQYPDQMVFQIYNDAGNVHNATGGEKIRMEVQLQAFAYATNDELNDMTFMRYKLINRSYRPIDTTYFAWWADPDLGCPEDDFVGCDIGRSLAYTYNDDATDGVSGCVCQVQGTIPTYCTEVPAIGTDYFRGPRIPDSTTVDPDDFIELGMSSFTYYNRGGGPNGDPGQVQEFYNYLTGKWKDGTPFTYGGTGYNPGSTQVIPYAFPDDPNNATGWSMRTAGIPVLDRRTIQASGPFKLDPGAVNELIVGVPWVAEVSYPGPDLSALYFADDIAQALFDNCFDITDGPDAPDVCWIEMDKQLVATFSNPIDSTRLVFNNSYEWYRERDLGAPDSSYYEFEGYIVYQLASADVSFADLDDNTKARAVQIVDEKNGVKKIYNWVAADAPGGNVFVPQLEVEAPDKGVRHSFVFTDDQFSTAINKRLINHKKYYYTVIAYAHNNEYNTFDVATQQGQKRAFLAGRRYVKTFTVIPRPSTYQNINANYGDGAEVTRIDGVGTGSNFLNLKSDQYDKILNGTTGDSLEYSEGGSPINVSVFDPLRIKDGYFELTMVDANMGDNILDPTTARWHLKNLSDPAAPVVISENTIASLNEELLGEYGFAVTIAQTEDVSEKVDETNGVIGAKLEYKDLAKPRWFTGITDDRLGVPLYNFLQTHDGEANFEFDPNQAFSRIGDGFFFPFLLTSYSGVSPEGVPIMSPMLQDASFGSILASVQAKEDSLPKLNNIDIVFTSDKSKWSRCPIVETGREAFTNEGYLTADPSAKNLDIRKVPSVGKDAGTDGLPAPDGAIEPATIPGTNGEPITNPRANQPLMGMGWFPGYAIDVETGKRLNIFFGENTVFDCENGVQNACENSFGGEKPTGRDMMWNPSTIEFGGGNFFDPLSWVMGGHHFIYVTGETYDGCEFIRTRLDPAFGSATRKTLGLRPVRWTAMPMLAQGTKLLSYAEGLIPNDLTVKIRVKNPYQTYQATGDFNGYPTYRFRFAGKQPKDVVGEAYDEALKQINVVPNPYYGYSAYEISEVSNIVKITNLPDDCTVTIYSIDGRFIKQYKRAERQQQRSGDNLPVRTTQTNPDIEWDLKNSKGIPVASGVYLIHVDAGALGERTIKWFGVGRQFDPARL